VALWARARWPWLVGPALAGLALAWRFMLYPIVGDRDSGVYLYIGSVVLRGGVPYRDVWDHKPPLIYYLDALALALGRGSLLGLQAIEVVALAVALGLGLTLLRRCFGGRAAVSAVLPLAISVPVLTDPNMVESFALPLQMATLALFVRGVERQQPTRFAYPIGFLGGLALLLKPNLVGVWPALLLAALLGRIVGPRQSLGLLLRMTLGGALPLLVAGGYFLSSGAAREAWDAVVVYNRIYAQSDPGSTFATVVLGLAATGLSGLSVMAVLAWLAVSRRRWRIVAPGPARVLVLAACLDLPLEVALSSLSGRAYLHYFVAWLPSLAVLAAYLAHSIGPGLASFGQRFGHAATGVWLVSLLGSLALPLTVRPSAFEANRTRIAALGALGEYVARATHPGDSVLVWGAEAEVNLAADRLAPGRFVYQYPLLTRGYTRPDLVKEFVQDLAERRPTLIVDVSAGDDHAVGVDRAGHTALEAPAKYVLANYVKVDAFGELGWPVYAYSGLGRGRLIAAR
jgi:Dolichyl-phosphate-mannose-protein mannosyltransferase